jgi:hypothetical protein
MAVLKYNPNLRATLDYAHMAPVKHSSFSTMEGWVIVDDEGELRACSGTLTKDLALELLIERRAEDAARRLKLQQYLEDNQVWQHTLVVPLLVVDEVAYFVSEAGWKRSGERPGAKWYAARWYHFQNCVYLVAGDYTEEQDRLLVQEEFDAERRKFERLKLKFSDGNAERKRNPRQGIPEEVRIAVWRRDGGACAKCGSREKLEYDHIVPVSRGGSDTVRNIELLCEACNRSKSNHIQ